MHKQLGRLNSWSGILSVRTEATGIGSPTQSQCSDENSNQHGRSSEEELRFSVVPSLNRSPEQVIWFGVELAERGVHKSLSKNNRANGEG